MTPYSLSLLSGLFMAAACTNQSFAAPAPAPSPSPTPKRVIPATSEYDLVGIGSFDTVAVSLPARAQNIAHDLARELPNFIAEQTIARYSRRASGRQVIDKLRGELYTGEVANPDGSISHVEEFRLHEYDDGARWVSRANLASRGSLVSPDEIRERFSRAPGLRALGIYANAMSLPFAEPGNLKSLGIREIARTATSKRQASAYSFDTAPRRLMVMEQGGQKITLPVRGIVYIDSNARPETEGRPSSLGHVLKIDFEAYDFPVHSRTQYSRQAIDFSWTRIEGLVKERADLPDFYWLPRAAIIALGGSAEEHFVNEMLFEKYKVFATDVKVADEEGTN